MPDVQNSDPDQRVTPDEAAELAALLSGLVPISWPEFWASPTTGPDWAIESVVPARRAAAIYSPAKVGKSLLALDVVAAAVTGRSVLGQPADDPIRVVYIDQEMTEDDLRERLTDLGYGPGDDLSGLAYYQLTALPPLDTAGGGEVLLGLAHVHGADLVVLDTMARVVAGPENDADTVRAFFRHTGARLKAAGVALLRVDHAGKDERAGQRGSSSKVDDLDVVWKLSGSGRVFTLSRTHSRIPWVPRELSIVRHDEPVLHHVIEPGAVPAGTHDAIQDLDALGVPLDAPRTAAMSALRAAGKGRRSEVVGAALKARRAPPTTNDQGGGSSFER